MVPRYMPAGRNLDVFFQKVGIRKGVRWGDGILVGFLQRTESGTDFQKEYKSRIIPIILSPWFYHHTD